MPPIRWLDAPDSAWDAEAAEASPSLFLQSRWLLAVARGWGRPLACARIGGATPGQRTSLYEDSLDKLFSLVAREPDRAAPVSAMLRLPQPAPDWRRLARKPVERAWQLFSNRL